MSRLVPAIHALGRSPDLFPAAILAGGLGTRLRPLTERVPKSLIQINGEPFIAHQLRLLRDRGLRDVVLCTGYLGEQVREYVADGSAFGVRVQYSPDGPALIGTGGAIRHALPLLGERFFVVYGDSYLPCDYVAAQQAFEASGKQGLMTVFENNGQWDTSNVEFSGGVIRAYDKKSRTPRMKFIDYGLGVFHHQAFAPYLDGPLDLPNVYQDLLAAGELAAFEVNQRFYEIGSQQGIDELREILSTCRAQALSK